jgi:uncharacterized protein (TIGR01777 family)
MQVVLAGGSGLIGSALTASLRADGHQVKTLVRHPAPHDDADVDSWDPARGLLDPDFLQGADAIVCLSGANVGGKRWTDAYKRQILQSRVDTVGTIARHLAEYGGPRVFIAASAVGYYGDTGDREVDESSPAGDSFLSEVCVQWEAAANPAREAGVRVAHTRSGIVLGRQAEVLKRLVPLVKAGLGAKIGTGQQYFAWISLHDEIAAIRFLLENDVSGPANLVAPQQVTNAEFTETLGRVLHRPTLLRAPKFAVRAVAGEAAGELLGGQRAVPRRLDTAGFTFTHRSLEAALRAELT